MNKKKSQRIAKCRNETNFQRLIKNTNNKKTQILNTLKESDAIKFISINNISKLLKIIDSGDDELIRFLRVNYVVYNYPSNWILFAKSFFNRSLKPLHTASSFIPRQDTIETMNTRFRIYFNIIRNYDDIKNIVHTFDKAGTKDYKNRGNKYRYR